jgi:hypothetical protein
VTLAGRRLLRDARGARVVLSAAATDAAGRNTQATSRARAR